MSTKHINWKPEYAIGVGDIDMQHHFFLDLINRLEDELVRTDNLVYQTALISELNAYARFHFISEENMMAHAGYPQLDEHKLHHRQLLEQLGNKELELDMVKSAREVQDVLDFLADWFIHHTIKEDKQFASFLEKQGQE